MANKTVAKTSDSAIVDAMAEGQGLIPLEGRDSVGDETDRGKGRIIGTLRTSSGAVAILRQGDGIQSIGTLKGRPGELMAALVERATARTLPTTLSVWRAYSGKDKVRTLTMVWPTFAVGHNGPSRLVGFDDIT